MNMLRGTDRCQKNQSEIQALCTAFCRHSANIIIHWTDPWTVLSKYFVVFCWQYIFELWIRIIYFHTQNVLRFSQYLLHLKILITNMSKSWIIVENVSYAEVRIDHPHYTVCLLCFEFLSHWKAITTIHPTEISTAHNFKMSSK